MRVFGEGVPSSLRHCRAQERHRAAAPAVRLPTVQAVPGAAHGRLLQGAHLEQLVAVESLQSGSGQGGAGESQPASKGWEAGAQVAATAGARDKGGRRVRHCRTNKKERKQRARHSQSPRQTTRGRYQRCGASSGAAAGCSSSRSPARPGLQQGRGRSGGAVSSRGNLPGGGGRRRSRQGHSMRARDTPAAPARRAACLSLTRAPARPRPQPQPQPAATLTQVLERLALGRPHRRLLEEPDPPDGDEDEGNQTDTVRQPPHPLQALCRRRGGVERRRPCQARGVPAGCLRTQAQADTRKK